MKSPEDTYEALIDLHGLFSDITRHLIQDDKAVKIERDRGEGAEQVIYIFARAVQRQVPSLKRADPQVGSSIDTAVAGACWVEHRGAVESVLGGVWSPGCSVVNTYAVVLHQTTSTRPGLRPGT